MSLETAIQENTKALQSLAEIIKQALSLTPVQPPVAVASAAPVQAEAAPAPAPEPKAASNEPVAAADLPPVASTKAAPAEPTTAPVTAPKAEPKAAPINYTELREAMVSKLQKLFEHSPAKGAETLRSFGVRRQSELPDEKLPAFCDALVKALEAEGVL